MPFSFFDRDKLSSRQDRRRPTLRGGSSPAKRRPGFRIDPIELLEARDVPATLYWLGAAGSDWNTDGWTNVSGGAAVSSLRPQNGDDLRFDTTQASFVDDPTSFGMNNSLSGLSGLTIRFNDASATGDFSLGGSQ